MILTKDNVEKQRLVRNQSDLQISSDSKAENKEYVL